LGFGVEIEKVVDVADGGARSVVSSEDESFHLINGKLLKSAVCTRSLSLTLALDQVVFNCQINDGRLAALAPNAD
jgi:hypothetical protein